MDSLAPHSANRVLTVCVYSLILDRNLDSCGLSEVLSIFAFRLIGDYPFILRHAHSIIIPLIESIPINCTMVDWIDLL